MATTKKFLQAAAGAAGGAGAVITPVQKVFSTNVYEGNGQDTFIDNNIKIGSGELWDYATPQERPIIHPVDLGFCTEFEIEFFFKPYILGGRNNQWFICTSQGYADPNQNGFLIGIYDSGGGHRIAIAGSNFGAYGFEGSTVLNENQQYHCVVNYSQSDNQLRVFLNGSQESSSNGGTSFNGQVFFDGLAVGMGRGQGTSSWQNPAFSYVSNLQVSDTRTRVFNFTPPSYTPENVTGDGGMVWVKAREFGNNHIVTDTERGVLDGYLKTNSIDRAMYEGTTHLTSFEPNGFRLGNNSDVNDPAKYVAWTFKKHERFFDVVTFTHLSITDSVIPHNLNCDVGFVLIKKYNGADNWWAWHRSASDGYLTLNTTNGKVADPNFFKSVTSTDITIDKDYLGDGNYVAYIFAHDPDGLISCGSLDNSSAEADIGWEPQWVLMKNSTGTGSWAIHDTIRGFTGLNRAQDATIYPDLPNAESRQSTNYIDLTTTGFKLNGFYTTGYPAIYVAIRRGPMPIPDEPQYNGEVYPASGFDVFNATIKYQKADGNYQQPAQLGKPIDILFVKTINLGTPGRFSTRRIFNAVLSPTATDAAGGLSIDDLNYFDSNVSASIQAENADGDSISWGFARAQGFCDTLTFSNPSTVNHSLGVVPELIITKRVDLSSDWAVSAPSLYSNYMFLNTNGQATGVPIVSNLTETSIDFSSDWYGANEDYICMMFASLDGISKVGKVTHTGGATTNIDCGFSTPARFVLVKKIDGPDAWYAADSERGFSLSIAINEANQELNTGYFSQTSNGFRINPAKNGGEYLYLAIA